MANDLGARAGASDLNLRTDWSNDVLLMHEVVAREHQRELESSRRGREYEFAQQVAVAKAARRARRAERLAAYWARRAECRRERADLLASLR